MKIIISRKGFDWANGNVPSPVLPDGTLLSMPIPSYDDISLGDLSYKGRSYRSIMEELCPRRSFSGLLCHLDPDIRKNNRLVYPDDWVPAFGQADTAQQHLENQGVEKGDLFLFFGWFGKTEEKNGQLKYIAKEKDLHIIWGYLQIGKIVKGKECSNYYWHPHAYGMANNTIYEASEHLVINGVDTGLPGAGCLRYSKDVVLTKEGETRSRWQLPEFFKEVNISCHSKDCFKPEGYFQSVRIGQEFVVSEDERVTEWARNLIVNNYDPEASLAATEKVIKEEKKTKKTTKKKSRNTSDNETVKTEKKTSVTVQKNVFSKRSDAIVNPTNKNLYPATELSRSIFKATGEEMKLKEDRKEFGICPEGSVVTTTGYRLCKLIIHVVTPKWQDGSHDEEKLLGDTYHRILDTARENKCKSITIPMITEEDPAFPIMNAACIFIDSVMKWVEENRDYPLNIYIVFSDQGLAKQVKKMMNPIEPDCA
ncbi:MAG: macro domain-containing protein [Erysipelotrichaceae bacterium]|nr:macro domain-containing protein [Erysipelotrichaceae bacterium]